MDPPPAPRPPAHDGDDERDAGTTTAPDAGGSGGTLDGGAASDGGNAGTKCLSLSVLESEDNGTEATADVIPDATGSSCGRLEAGDSDFLTFTFPAAATRIGWGLETAQRGVTMTVTAGGTPVTLNEAPQPGKTYVVKLGSTGTTPADYIVKLTIQ